MCSGCAGYDPFSPVFFIYCLRCWWWGSDTDSVQAAHVCSSCSAHQCLWDGSPDPSPGGCQAAGWARYPDIIRGLKWKPSGDYFVCLLSATQNTGFCWWRVHTCSKVLCAEHCRLELNLLPNRFINVCLNLLTNGNSHWIFLFMPLLGSRSANILKIIFCFDTF